MPLAVGTRLGPYEILAPIGEGGMGEVYKGRDTRLERFVAIKVSKEQFSERFEREARAVAALNHFNICQLYDVGPDYLIMEFIEGTPLAGPLALEKAAEYAGQILDALDAAHQKGIIHRDLKPSNILVTKQGIKLLDFGLAKSSVPLKESDDTLTRAMTQPGQILGTLQYMSPEELQGKPADARSDLFSFGRVLYEMLTGKRTFEGVNRPGVVAAILEREPALLGIPKPLERLLKRSLAKNPDQRFQTARDLKAALAWALEQPPPGAAAKSQRSRWIEVAVALVLGAGGMWTVMRLRQPAADERALHLEVNPPPGTEFRIGVMGGSAISPDGAWIAFVAASEGSGNLWVRPIDSVKARVLPGTDGASFPFWSPDSLSIGFFASGKLKRVDISGGPPSIIADSLEGKGGTWNAAGTILYSPASVGGLRQVPASGGSPVVVTKVDPTHEESSHRWPSFLEGGRKFIFFSRNIKPHLSGIYLSSLDRPGEKTQLVESVTGGSYSPPHAHSPGYLVWLRDNTLTAQPFDPATGQLSGRAAPVAGADGVFFTPGFNLAGFSLSREGKLLFNSGSHRFQLTWFSREGKVLSTVGQTERFATLRISPDGRQAAVSVMDVAPHRDAWRLEFARGIQSPITFTGHGALAVWSPDAGRIVSSGAGLPMLFESPANGAGAEKTILQSRGSLSITDWSPDGRYLAYTELLPETGFDLWLLPMTGNRTPVPFLQTRFNELHGTFRPDGKWMAYVSDESGHQEVYVQSVPTSGPKWQVSNSGGSFPRWRRDGKELFYRAPEGKLMAAPVRTMSAALEFGSPEVLFRVVDPQGTGAYPYDVAPDGRILALTPAGGARDTATMTVIVNWAAGLKNENVKQ